MRRDETGRQLPATQGQGTGPGFPYPCSCLTKSTLELTRPVITLVVGSDADLRLYIRQGLRAFSPRARVIEAADGIEALTLARAGAVDFVISDVAMPRLDGHGLYTAIRKDPELQHIPVLLLCEDASAPRASGPYLAKPFNSRQLREAVNRSRPALSGNGNEA